jgi:NAD(P)-dependent dehydrogenase (short-subunit alcohol dehydrogenase family)
MVRSGHVGRWAVDTRAPDNSVAPRTCGGPRPVAPRPRPAVGPLLTVKHAARRMRDGGSIILTASLNAVQPAAGMSAYCCSKAGLAMLAQVAALELGPKGIRVNAIGPGLVRTGLTEPMWLVPSIIGEFEENQPRGTAITPDDVAGLVAFLASDEASAISGSLQLIDGAAHTRRYPDLLPHLTAGSAEVDRDRAEAAHGAGLHGNEQRRLAGGPLGGRDSPGSVMQELHHR